MPPAVNVLALSIDHDRLTPVVAGSTGDVWPPRAVLGQCGKTRSTHNTPGQTHRTRAVSSVAARRAGDLHPCGTAREAAGRCGVISRNSSRETLSRRTRLELRERNREQSGL